MARHRSHSVAFKRQVAAEFISGETLHALSKRHDISRQRSDLGVRGQNRSVGADGRAAGVGVRTAKGGFEACTLAEKREHLGRHRPFGLSVARRCELMGLWRSTFYDPAPVPLEKESLLARIGTICDGFECYGYRRVGAALRHQGVVVYSEKLRRLMREHSLQPKRRHRYVVTTDSDHGGLILPDLTKDLVPDRPNQLWVADLGLGVGDGTARQAADRHELAGVLLRSA